MCPVPPPASPDKEPQFISRVHAAELLDVSTQLIDKLIRNGQLQAYRVGRKVIVSRRELLALLQAGAAQ